MNIEHGNRTLKEELEASLVNGRLSCIVAFQIARKLKVSQRQVGEMANRLNIRISNCQLGCFILEKAVHDDLDSLHISKAVAEEVEAFLVGGRFPCAVVFKVAKKLKVAPKEVADAANKLNIKIVNCQLGCFP